VKDVWERDSINSTGKEILWVEGGGRQLGGVYNTTVQSSCSERRKKTITIFLEQGSSIGGKEKRSRWNLLTGGLL